MKNLPACSFILIAAFAGSVLAETPVLDASTEACSLVGPLPEASTDCAALRVAYRSEVSACMEQLHAEADARAGKPTMSNSHTSRARFLICDKAARKLMPQLGN